MTDWFVLYTQSRAEKKVSESLSTGGFESYLPSRIVERREWRTHEIRETRLPLFPRYVFVRGFDAMPWFQIHQTSGVQGNLTADGLPATVPGQTITTIKEAQALGIFDLRIPRTPTLRYGQKVRFKEGSFAGRKAVVQRMMSKKTVKVMTRVLSADRYVTVPVDDLLVLA